MLSEPVRIVTGCGPDLCGELVVGADCLPELEASLSHRRTETYRPATIPNEWLLIDASDERIDGPLLEAWRKIEQIQHDIRVAQRDADAEDRDRAQQREQDAIDIAKADMEAKGER